MAGGNWKEMFNAACEGDLELVRYHVKNGVDVNFAHPEFEATALVACALEGREEIALYLLQVGADPNLLSESDGLTPIQAARRARLPALEAQLLQMGAVEPPAGAVGGDLGWLHRLGVCADAVRARFLGRFKTTPQRGD